MSYPYNNSNRGRLEPVKEETSNSRPIYHRPPPPPPRGLQQSQHNPLPQRTVSLPNIGRSNSSPAQQNVIQPPNKGPSARRMEPPTAKGTASLGYNTVYTQNEEIVVKYLTLERNYGNLQQVARNG